MDLAGLLEFLRELPRMFYKTLIIGIIVEVFLERITWVIVDLNKFFHEKGHPGVLVQILASCSAVAIAFVYMHIAIQLTAAWRVFVYTQLGVAASNGHTPMLIAIFTVAVYLIASILLRQPVKRRLHMV